MSAFNSNQTNFSFRSTYEGRIVLRKAGWVWTKHCLRVASSGLDLFYVECREYSNSEQIVNVHRPVESRFRLPIAWRRNTWRWWGHWLQFHWRRGLGFGRRHNIWCSLSRFRILRCYLWMWSEDRRYELLVDALDWMLRWRTVRKHECIV